MYVKKNWQELIQTTTPVRVLLRARIFFGLHLRRTVSILFQQNELTASYVVVSFFRFPQRAIRLRLLKIRFANCYLPDCVPNNFWKQEINYNWIWSSPCFFLLKVCPLLWIFNLLFLCVLFVVLFCFLLWSLAFPLFLFCARRDIYKRFLLTLKAPILRNKFSRLISTYFPKN